MSILNTSCEKCYFADKADADVPCKFYIPDVIKDTKDIDIINEYYYIRNYRCKYGVSRDIANTKLKDFNIDIEDYAKNQVRPKYTLYIKIYDKDQFENTCSKIKSLQIQPNSINIVFDYDFDVSDVQSIATNILGDSLRWKLHRFVEPLNDWQQLYTSMITDPYLNASQYIWILNDSLLDICYNADSINRINFIVNVQQPNLGILTHKSIKNEYFFGLFITTDNLKGIWEHVDKDLNSVIQSMYQKDVGFYN